MTLRAAIAALWAMTCVVLLAACTFEEFTRDGAMCSERATCPPGQSCSADGQCLRSCPTIGCVNDTCACDDEATRWTEATFVCLSDGLCHFECQDASDCPADNLCDTAFGLCRPKCDLEHSPSCANGATCTGQGFCHGP